MRIKDYLQDERPREKMLAKGAGSLSNSELVAIILRTGTARENAVELAHRLLAICNGNLCLLSSTSVDRMKDVSGIGAGKACMVAAALELGRRMFAENTTSEKISVCSAEMVYRMMIPMLRGLDHEEFWIVYLNRANFVIDKERLSSGGMSSTVIDHKVIMRRVIEKKASGIIIVHNHPSGKAEPGSNDLKETENLRKACNALQISLVDHVIICDDRYYSFADEAVCRVRQI